jgi:hypothetical protein
MEDGAMRKQLADQLRVLAKAMEDGVDYCLEFQVGTRAMAQLFTDADNHLGVQVQVATGSSGTLQQAAKG